VKLHRLRVLDFGTIAEADIEFGPGLNILYGPNDLGKSTLADAIRLALLLPHTSTHIEEYVPWTGGRDPVVELTFETGPQRIWRVKKEFRKAGAALLQESKNGNEFNDVERARKVDGKLRELLRWGIPEPGGTGGGRGLPTSFLATVLLSTQSDVAAVLKDSLQDDASGTGKERIAAALEAAMQHPLFVALRRATQARRDEAYTDKGAKKTARGSVFKTAADRVNVARAEKEMLQRAVDGSGSVEHQLRELVTRRGHREEAVASATERLAMLEQLAAAAASRAEAAGRVALAHDEVQRIRKIGADVNEAVQAVAVLSSAVAATERTLLAVESHYAEAAAAFTATEDNVRAAGSDPAMTDVVARQGLELRKARAEQAAREAHQQIDRAVAAQRLVDAVVIAARDHPSYQRAANVAATALADATAKQQLLDQQLRRSDVLERALDVRAAEAQVALAQAAVDSDTNLRAQLDRATTAREALAARRSAMTVPEASALVPMRRLAADLAAARGALNVGLVVTITPHAVLDMRIKRDRSRADATSTAVPMEIDANTAVDVEISGVASVRVRGGRRGAQKAAEALEERWTREVAPQLAAANVGDLDALAAAVSEADRLDADLKAGDAALESLRSQMAALDGCAATLLKATERAAASRALLGDTPLETLAADLAALGTDPLTTLRKRRQQLSNDLHTARTTASESSTAHAVATERGRHSRATLDAALAARDAAVADLPGDPASALAAAQTALAAAIKEQQQIATELAAVEHTIAAQQARIETALRDARTAVEQARARIELAQAAKTRAIADHALQAGRLGALQTQRDAEDLSSAENRLQEATASLAALPIPERAKAALDEIERDIQRTHGALEQVGGAVARDRLRDVTEAFEAAERREREIEADYEAWSLLLEQMKEADAAQASSLGQVFAPAVADRFETLTQQRYENVKLTAQLGTEGVVVGGAVRSTERISVGTREQLATLYRLSMAEYLSTAVVLDDQLVQSDLTRMDWFRALLAEKARLFQIVVFTCRPGDYLAANAMAAKGKVVHKDTDGGLVRAIDLGRAVRRR
jgi:hypothetical protein